MRKTNKWFKDAKECIREVHKNSELDYTEIDTTSAADAFLNIGGVVEGSSSHAFRE